MPRAGRIATFDDPDAFASAIHNCKATFAPTRPGRFKAHLALAKWPEMSLCEATEYVPRRAVSSFPPHRFFIRLIAPWDRRRLRDGVADIPGTIIVHSGDNVADDVSTGPTVSRSVSVPMATMLSSAEQLFAEPGPFLNRHAVSLRLPEGDMRRLLAMHWRLVRLSSKTASRAEAQTAVMQAAMWDALIGAMANTEPAPGAALLCRGQAIMRRLLDYIGANDDRPIALSELCAVAGCSAKSLETLFLRNLGETPNRYMRRWRLWRTREVLAAADPAIASVSGIAVSFGFWELGRFAVAYRALFGEGPSQTLRAPPSLIDPTLLRDFRFLHGRKTTAPRTVWQKRPEALRDLAGPRGG